MTPWSSGLIVAALCALMAGAASFAFAGALAQVHPLLSVTVNAVAAVGVAPTLWSWRQWPVRRWVVLGIVVGVPIGWLTLLG